MTHGFVQQHAGPARAEHHRHHAGRRRYRLKVHQRLTQRLKRERFRPAVGEQFRIAIAATATGIAGLAAAVVLDDHLHVQAHQRAHVGAQHAVAAGDQHGIHAAGQADHHLLHARVRGTQIAVQALEHLDLGLVADTVDRVQRRVQRTRVATQQRAPGLRAAFARDRACRLRRYPQRIGMDVIGIGKAGLLAGNRPHAHALLDGMGTVLDDAVLHAPALAAGVLEVEVAKVDTGAEQLAEGALQASGIQATGAQQAVLGKRQGDISHGSRSGGAGAPRQAR
ncbi:hypothetical protein G6F22_011089 [Rhizopus arrhizus]|nr:hypothetical protein G6F22_011089 [Rhizopus arrhizus]